MKKLKALSLFSNVGIAETYFEEIGIDVLLANEIEKDRAEFYRHVYPNTEMIIGDITDDNVRNEIVNKAKNYEVDFVIATPPCQGMSEAGKRLEYDPRNQLIHYALDTIERIKPKYVLLENVPKQLITKIYYDDEIILIPDYIKRKLSSEYKFNKNILVKARDHGIPQIRERNIFLLVRKDLDVEWEFPEKEKEVTLKEAIGDIPSIDPEIREGYELTIKKFPKFEQKKARGLQVSKWHYPPKHPLRHVVWMEHTPTGKSAIYNEVYFPKKADGSRIKAHHNNYRRQKWEMPGRTITQNNGVLSSLATVHPGHAYIKNGEILYSDPRVLTIYEVMVIMSLPSDWNIPEWATDRFIRKVIGEGIPPLLVKKIMLELLNKTN